MIRSSDLKVLISNLILDRFSSTTKKNSRQLPFVRTAGQGDVSQFKQRTGVQMAIFRQIQNETAPFRRSGTDETHHHSGGQRRTGERHSNTLAISELYRPLKARERENIRMESKLGL